MELWREQVPADARPTTVGRYLAGPLGFSSTLVRRLKAAGGISLNGAVVKTNHPLLPGDELRLTLPASEAPNVAPEPLTLTVVYEDLDLIVLDKAPGVVVHPTHGVYTGTLANGLAHRFAERGEPTGIHPVHRLDRDTSGLVLFARHALAHQRLDQQLQSRVIRRAYLALAWGQPPDAGVVDAPIGLRGDHPVARSVREDGQGARTHYEVLDRFRETSLLRLHLDTGRTHQIRVHLAHLGHPLVGDRLYGPDFPQAHPRQALHAATLDFAHPRTGEALSFASLWPADLAQLLASLR